MATVMTGTEGKAHTQISEHPELSALTLHYISSESRKGRVGGEWVNPKGLLCPSRFYLLVSVLTLMLSATHVPTFREAGCCRSLWVLLGFS